jgi:signal transduction histidine kinase
VSSTVPGPTLMSRGELERLAREQAALRRVATIVACGESPSTVFAAVTKEAGQVLGADMTRLIRYEPAGTTRVMGVWGGPDGVLPIGDRWPIVGDNLESRVLRHRSAARMNCFGVSPMCVYLKTHGIRSGVGTPITVDGACWGAMLAYSTRERLLPADAETRNCDFTDLVATAIANANAHAELATSRARLVAAADHARRQIERNLHDGTQQRLISVLMELRVAEERVPADAPGLRQQLAQISAELTDTVNELRELARGIHPAALAHGGLEVAIKTLARRSPVPVRFEADIPRRLPESVEVAAYYVVAEALCNTWKYARASTVHITAAIRDGRLCVTVCDDGVGGADPSEGSGLIGLADRIQALGGTIEIMSRAGEGTLVRVELPPPATEGPGDPPANGRSPAILSTTL